MASVMSESFQNLSLDNRGNNNRMAANAWNNGKPGDNPGQAVDMINHIQTMHNEMNQNRPVRYPSRAPRIERDPSLYTPHLVSTEIKDAFGNVFSETGDMGTVHYKLKKPHSPNVDMIVSYTNVGGPETGRNDDSGLVVYPINCNYVEVEKTPQHSAAVDIVNPSNGVPVALQSPPPPHQKHPTQSTPVMPESIIQPCNSALNGEASEFSPRVFSPTDVDSAQQQIFCGSQQADYQQKMQEMKQSPMMNQMPIVNQPHPSQMQHHQQINALQSPSINAQSHMINQMPPNINIPPPNMMQLPPNINQPPPTLNPPMTMQQFMQIKQQQNPQAMNLQGQMHYPNQPAYIHTQQPNQLQYPNNMIANNSQNSLLSIQNQMTIRPPQSKGLNIVVQPSRQVFEQFQPNRNYGDNSQGMASNPSWSRNST